MSANLSCQTISVPFQVERKNDQNYFCIRVLTCKRKSGLFELSEILKTEGLRSWDSTVHGKRSNRIISYLRSRYNHKLLEQILRRITHLDKNVAYVIKQSLKRLWYNCDTAVTRSCGLFYQPFKPEYTNTNSPDWSPYISLKNWLREFVCWSKLFPSDDHFINSHHIFLRLCIGIVRRFMNFGHSWDLKI